MGSGDLWCDGSGCCYSKLKLLVAICGVGEFGVMFAEAIGWRVGVKRGILSSFRRDS